MGVDSTTDRLVCTLIYDVYYRRSDEFLQGLKGRHKTHAPHVPPLQGGETSLGSFTWGFTPGCHIAGFQPCEQRRIVSELDALQAEVDALKRLQAETAAGLDALLPSILDKAFRGDL